MPAAAAAARVAVWAWTLPFFCLPSNPLQAADKPAHEVLILHSYDPNMLYTRLQEAGIRQAIAEAGIGPVSFGVEYLDLSNRVRNTEYLEALSRFYALKFETKRYDLVITTDTPAFDFLYNEGRTLLKGIPLVFSAMKDIHPPVNRTARDVVGVFEAIDVKETIELALRLHPDAKRIVAVNDQSGFGRELRKRSEPVINRYSKNYATIWIEVTRENIGTQINNLHPGDIILFLALSDPRGRSIDHPDAVLNELCRKAPAPVYALYDAYLGSGIVGGKLASGEWQGRAAGRLAARILKGERASSIPLITASPNPYLFDDRALTRWNIPLKKLPPDSVIKFRDPTFFENYQHYVLIAVAALGLEGLIIVALLVARFHRKRAETLLRTERDLLQTVMNATPSGILLISPDASITLASRRAEELFGIDHQSFFKLHFNAPDWSFADSNGRPLAPDETPYARVMNTGCPIYDVELAIRKSDDSWWLALCSGIPIRSDSGKVASIVFSFEDITLRHHNEQALRDAKLELESRVRARTAELLEANRALRKAIRERYRAELESRHHQDELAHVQRLASMGEMATGLAHEINQPLAAIVSFTQGCIRRLESKSINPDELRGAMTEVSNQAHRAGEIIRRLRAFVRKEKAPPVLVHVNDVVRNAVTMIQTVAKNSIVDLNLDLGDNIRRVQADSIQLEQVILNVLRNGIDAVQTTRDGARRVTVTTRNAEQNRVAIEVTDTGPGLTPEARSRVFEPFFTTKSQGMGMGLALSRSIIESHGGQMHFVDHEGPGATIRITLPKAYDAKSVKPEADAPAATPAQDHSPESATA